MPLAEPKEMGPYFIMWSHPICWRKRKKLARVIVNARGEKLTNRERNDSIRAETFWLLGVEPKYVLS